MESYIKILDKTIYYKILHSEFLASDKPILLFLHEGLGCVEQWKDFPDVLCQKLGLSALLYDRYGHGKSEKLSEERNFDFLHKEAFEFLPELLNKLNINNKLIIVGHSDGATLALIYASKYWERINFVVSMAHHIFVEKMSQEGIFKAIKLFESGWLSEKLEKYHGKNTETMFYAWANTWTKPEVKDWNINELLQNINCPIITIQGVNDEYGTYEQLEFLKKHSKNIVEIFHLQNCGHIPHLQAKEEVFNIIEKFYNKNYL